MKPLKTTVFGFVFGVASPIPGVDSGTVFILFNAYEDIINSAKLSIIKQKFPKILLFLLGCVAGLLGIGNLMNMLLTYHEQITYYSFSGLIAGCVPMIFKKSDFAGKRLNLNVKSSVIFFACFALIIFLALTASSPDQFAHMQSESGIPPGWVFFAAAVSGIGMLFPGVGGALIMLVTGIYNVYIEAIANLDFPTLFILAAGMICGILAGLRLARKILHTYPKELYCAILGFTIGSLFFVIPGFSFDLIGALSILFAAFFAVAAYKISKR